MQRSRGGEAHGEDQTLDSEWTRSVRSGIGCGVCGGWAGCGAMPELETIHYPGVVAKFHDTSGEFALFVQGGKRDGMRWDEL